MALTTLREQQAPETMSFLWKIPKFAEMRYTEEVVNAQAVTLEMGGEIGMRIKWKGYLQRRNRNIGVYVKLLDYPKHWTAVHAHLLVKIIRHDFDLDCGFYCTKCNKWGDMNKNMIDGTGQGFDCIILKSWPNLKNITDNDGALHLTFTITLLSLENPQIAILLTEYQEKFANQHNKVLARACPPDLTLHRVTILSKAGDEFSGDPVILAKRSPVFQADMMSEAKTGVMKVDDIRTAPLDGLLEFCHMGTLPENWKEEGVLEGLLYGAHMYMLEDLKEFLGKALPLLCKPHNCGKLMSLARAFEMKEAQVKLFEFFKQKVASSFEEMTSIMEDATRAPEERN